MPVKPDVLSTYQRWMQFAITTGTIVVSTGAFVWAMMVYALDEQYVRIEDFETFKEEIEGSISRVESSTQLVVKTAVSDLQCDLMRSELNDLEATILYKNDHGIPAGLDQVLRDQKLRTLESRRDCTE